MKYLGRLGVSLDIGRATGYPWHGNKPTVYVTEESIEFISKTFTKSRIRQMLQDRSGNFRCEGNYNWQITPTGGVTATFERRGILGQLTVSPVLLNKIRKWAKEK